MPIALLARPLQLLEPCRPGPTRPPRCCRQDIQLSRPFAYQADDNPMGDIGKKISDFFSGLMPKDEEPPTSARWSERLAYGGGRGAFGWRRSAPGAPPPRQASPIPRPSPLECSGLARMDAPVARQPRPLRRAEAP
jgi:hypothetical protein